MGDEETTADAGGGMNSKELQGPYSSIRGTYSFPLPSATEARIPPVSMPLSREVLTASPFADSQLQPMPLCDLHFSGVFCFKC